MNATLTSPLYQFKNLLNPTTVGSGANATVVMSEFEVGFDPQNPSFMAADGATTEIDPASGQVVASITDGDDAVRVEYGGWTSWPRERVTSGIHATQIHDLVVDAPPGELGFVTHLGNFPMTDLVTDGTTTFVAQNSVVAAIPAKGCQQSTCPPSWSTSAFFSGHLTVTHGMLFGVSINGDLAAVSASGCGANVCQPVWTAPLGGAGAALAATGAYIYVTNGTTLSVFSTDGCGAATCTPLWTSTASGTLSAPSLVNDLVLAGDAAGNVVTWNQGGCGAATCSPIASLPQGGAVGVVTPIDHALVFTVGGALRKLVLPS